MGKILPDDPRWSANVNTVGDLRRAIQSIPDSFEVSTYGGEWSSYTLVRDIIADQRFPDNDRLAALQFHPPRLAHADLTRNLVISGTPVPAREVGGSRVPVLVRERIVTTVLLPAPYASSDGVTVGELRSAIQDVDDAVELYVFGGMMLTSCTVHCVVPDMRDVDHGRQAVVFFWCQYRPQPGEGWKQLPPGTRGYVPEIDEAKLPWFIRWLLRLIGE